MLEAGAKRDTKNKIGKSAAMMCGFVNMKSTHRLLNCWIDQIDFFDEYTASMGLKRRRRLRRFLSHPNCLPISLAKRIANDGIEPDKRLIVHLKHEIKAESEFPIALRFQLIVTVLQFLLDSNLQPLKLLKRLLKDKELYSKIFKI